MSRDLEENFHRLIVLTLNTDIVYEAHQIIGIKNKIWDTKFDHPQGFVGDKIMTRKMQYKQCFLFHCQLTSPTKEGRQDITSHI